MSPEFSCVDKANKNWLPWQRSLGNGKKTNYSRSSTKLKNVAKIGSRYVEIIGLTKIVKNKKQQQNI